MQKFLYISGDISEKDKGNLQKEMLDTVFAEGLYCLQPFFAPLRHSMLAYKFYPLAS